MNWINLKYLAAIVTSALVAGTTTHVVQQRETNRLLEENRNLLVQQAGLMKERDDALSTATAQTIELDRQRQNQNELLRLRGEVGQLRSQQAEFVRVQAENQKLRQMARNTAAPGPVVEPGPVAQSAEAERNQCLNNLRQIDGAMQQCALENNFTVTNVVTAEQILPYLRNQQLPRCPAGGTYTFGSLTNVPTCSIPGHALP
jgi:hypothetical protein